MRIGEVIGSVTLSLCHPSLEAATWRIVVPFTRSNLEGTSNEREEPLVVFDELRAGIGNRIAFTESAEASAPFYPEQKPIDAYNAAILDTIDVTSPGKGIG